MKKFSLILVVLALVLCLFTGCGNVSTRDDGKVGNDDTDNPVEDVVDGVEEGVDDMVDPDRNDQNDVNNNQTDTNTDRNDTNTAGDENAAGQDEANTEVDDNAAANDDQARSRTANRPGRHVTRGTGTAGMVTGEEPARDRNTIAG